MPYEEYRQYHAEWRGIDITYEPIPLTGGLPHHEYREYPPQSRGIDGTHEPMPATKSCYWAHVRLPQERAYQEQSRGIDRTHVAMPYEEYRQYHAEWRGIDITYEPIPLTGGLPHHEYREYPPQSRGIDGTHEPMPATKSCYWAHVRLPQERAYQEQSRGIDRTHEPIPLTGGLPHQEYREYEPQSNGIVDRQYEAEPHQECGQRSQEQNGHRGPMVRHIVYFDQPAETTVVHHFPEAKHYEHCYHTTQD
jgi:hypothetical protein